MPSSLRHSAAGACPVMAFQRMISGKYKARILWDLKDGPLRYGELRRGLQRGAEGSREIAPRILSRELKALAKPASSRARISALCRRRSSIG